MFAHQVIEDINKYCRIYSNDYPNDHNIFHHCNELIHNIKQAQHFHMGDINELEILFKRDAGKLLLQEHYIHKLPYPVMWFDFTLSDFTGYKPTNASLEMIHNTKEAVLVRDIGDNTWNVNMFTYVKEASVWSVSSINYHVTLSDILTTVKPIVVDGVYRSQEWIDTVVKEDNLNFKMLQCSLKLLNCKNITTERIMAQGELNKKRRKTGRQELFNYHVLNIILPSEKKGYRESVEPLSHNRVHLCRGHFKEYTKECPLFGRYVGLYWWQPCVRGRNKEGMIIKDYAITTKREENYAAN